MKRSHKRRIFLDYAAGRDNPNAIYKEGRDIARRLTLVRKKIAGVISVAGDEVFLTSGGAEATLGLVALVNNGDHIITTQIEHESSLNLFAEFESLGIEVTYLAPNRNGIVSVKDVEKILRPNTKLVSVMYANNEIGTIQPIKEISRLLRSRLSVSGSFGKNPQSRRNGQFLASRPIFHSDCVQAPGLLSINMQSLGVDLASFSAPKFGGPVGIGFLYKRRWVKMRLPKENAAVNLTEEMCKALVKAESKREKEVNRLTKLRDYFIDRVLRCVPETRLNGPSTTLGMSLRLANNANFVFPIESELLVLELDNASVAASGGAACSNKLGLATPKPCENESHVIMAIGKSKQEARSSVRFSLGADTRKCDLDYVIKLLPKIINRHTNIWPSLKRQ